MKPNFFLTAFFTIFCHILLPAQAWQFAKRYSASTGSTLTNAAVSTAPDGSTYFVGTIRGTVAFDSINISVPTPAGVYLGYLLKLNPNAQAEWIQTFDKRPYHVTTDAQGNAFVAGAAAAGSPASDSLTYIAKYDPNGQLLDTFLSTGTGKSWARVVRTDAAGNCYVAGWKTGAVSFGAVTLPDQGDRDNYLVKLSPDLDLVNWAVNTGSSNKLDEVYDMELDGDGGIYTSGNYSQTFNIFCFCYNGSFFTEKRNANNGALIWQKIYSGGSGTTTQQVLALAADGQTLYTASSFKNTVQIPPNITLTAQNGTDDYHLFTSGMNTSNGNVQWAQKISFTGDSYITGMTLAEDELHLHGYFKSNTLMGNILLEPLGTYDAFYARAMPANGNIAGAEKFSGNSTDQGFGIASGSGRLAVSGNTSSATLAIGNFNLPGSLNSIYVAGKIYDVPLSISVTDVTDASCPGATDGSATASAQGGAPPYSYLWSNGQTGATLTGVTAGMYTVTAIDNEGAQISTSVTISEPPALTAGFTNAVNGLTASFSNTSSNAASYLWDFGDGQTSTETNPTHAYANCGTYTVALTATNLCGTTTSTASVIIGSGLPEADFAIAVNDLTASFSNTSSNANAYSWDFGDGQTSTEVNPAHHYSDCGTYSVTLTATNLCGTTTSTASVIIGNGLPEADFAITVNDLTASFSNASSNANAYSWDFGDGQTSTEVNPAHHYSDCGTYSVTLTATNLCGTTTSTASVIIGNGLPEADFAITVNDLTASFSNASSNANAYSWDFGDGQTSTEANPAHHYSDCGTYSVTLTATNLCGTTTSTASVIIGSGLPEADFAITVNDLTASFSNASSNANAYSWDFGDGQTSTEANPAHNYSNCGTYSVILTATNLCGTTTSTASVIIGNGLPEAGFASTVDSLTASFSNTSSNAASYFWDFGDGQTSTGSDPIHTYSVDGIYTVILIAGNLCGTDTFSQTVIIPPFGEAPVADFTADKLTVCAGDTVHFSNLSVNADTISWWFPGGEPMHSMENNPAVVFSDAGMHSVILTVYNAFGEDQEIKNEYITVIGLPVANFGVDTGGLTVIFSDSSLHADDYFWEFGDGTTSTDPAPTHIYANPGAYTIRLTVQNTCGADVLEKTVELGMVSADIPEWLGALRLYPNPNNGIFTLELNGPASDMIEFALLGADGRLIRQETAGFSGGVLIQRFDFSAEVSGIYLLRIRAGEKVTFAKVLIQS